jgi:dienelactone hydrolase
VSYGYIVIAPNTSNTGTGVEMLKGVDWVLAQNQQAGSPISGKVDVEHIGAFGHSQGGAGTCRAGADPRIDAIATLSGASSVNEIQCPAFFVTTGGEAGSSPDARIQETLSQASKPSMYGITVGGNHDEYTDKADEGITAFIGLTSNDGVQSRAAVTAWFDWQLKGMQEVGELFRQKPCKFCNRENLQRLDLDGF